MDVSIGCEAPGDRGGDIPALVMTTTMPPPPEDQLLEMAVLVYDTSLLVLVQRLTGEATDEDTHLQS